MHRNSARHLLTSRGVKCILAMKSWSNRFGPKRLLVEHWKSYRMVCILINFLQFFKDEILIYWKWPSVGMAYSEGKLIKRREKIWILRRTARHPPGGLGDLKSPTLKSSSLPKHRHLLFYNFFSRIKTSFEDFSIKLKFFFLVLRWDKNSRRPQYGSAIHIFIRVLMATLAMQKRWTFSSSRNYF